MSIRLEKISFEIGRASLPPIRDLARGENKPPKLDRALDIVVKFSPASRITFRGFHVCVQLLQHCNTLHREYISLFLDSGEKSINVLQFLGQ